MDRNVCQLTYVVIPMWNEASTIRQVVLSTLQVIQNIIIVDDCSVDNSREQISDLPVTVLHHDRNIGKGGALASGFQEALKRRATRVITLDADRQHDPQDIPRLLDAAMVYPQSIIIGARLTNRQHAPIHRYLANRCGDFFISWVCGQSIIDTQSGFRLYPADFLQQLDLTASQCLQFDYECLLLIYASQQKKSTVAVSIKSYYPDHARASYFDPIHDMLKIIKVVAKQLCYQKFNLPGLWHVLRRNGRIYEGDAHSSHDKRKY